MLFRLMKLQKTHPSPVIGKVSVEAKKILITEFAEKIVPDKGIREIVCNPKLDWLSQTNEVVDLLIKQRNLSKQEALKKLQELTSEHEWKLNTIMRQPSVERLIKRMGAKTPEEYTKYFRAIVHQLGTIENALLYPAFEAESIIRKI